MIDVPYEVKKALREGTYRKNYRFVVLHDDWTEDFTIDNDNLVKESVSIDERMCSGDTIKYGLCEGSSLEFQYFEKPNITGRRVQAFVDVEYEKVITQYSWETQEQFSTVFTVTDMSGDCRLYTELDSAWDFVYVTENGTTTQVYPTATESGTIIELGDVTGRTLIVSLPVIPAPTADLQLLVPHVGPAILTHPIPLGFFMVRKCSRQASTGIIKVTAYNKLQSDYLDAKANHLLLDTFAEDEQVTVFDIRYGLLGDYKIIEDRTALEPTYPEPMTILPGMESTLGTDFKFTALYGKKSPINAYEFRIANTSDTFSLHTNGDILTYNLPVKSQIDARYGSLRGLEENIVNYLKKIINDAGLNKTWDDVLDYVCTHGGFQEIIGAFDFALAIDHKAYSTIQWDYEEAHGLAHTVEGKIVDAQRLTRSGASFDIVVPNNISAWESGQTDRPWISYDGILERFSPMAHINYYEYYVDSSLTTTAREDMPFAVFSDGTKYQEHDASMENWAVVGYTYDNMSDADLIVMNREDIPDFTLREIQTAVYETQSQFGQLSRTTDLFSGVELGHSRLLPAETLYPATDLYPGGARLSGNKAMYSKLWADEGNIHKWRNLIITYKGLDEEENEKEFTLQKQVNADGTDDYNCSDNWLFKNLVWTESQIEDYADAMVAKMQGITWFPFEMWCAGLPYLETGDEIEIPLGDQKYVSYVLQRQLKGIQNLQDTYINGTLDIY